MCPLQATYDLIGSLELTSNSDRTMKQMRMLWLLTTLLTAPIFAAELSDIPGLEEAVRSHDNALIAKDRLALQETVVFPHVQFFPDGRINRFQKPDDLPDLKSRPRDWRVRDIELVSHQTGVAIVWVTFEATGDRAGQCCGQGWWGFVNRDGKWLILWRQYIGRYDPN